MNQKDLSNILKNIKVPEGWENIGTASGSNVFKSKHGVKMYFENKDGTQLFTLALSGKSEVDPESNPYFPEV